MTDAFFSFVQDGYLFNSPGNTIYSGLPTEIGHCIDTHNVATCRSFTISEFGGFFLSYEDQSGRAFNCTSEVLKEQFPDLEEWLLENGSWNAKVVICRDSYIAWHSSGAYKLHGVGDAVVARLYEEVEEKGRSIKCVALGFDGAFVILWKDGGYTWNLGRQYSRLNAILRSSSVGSVEFVALNPYKPDEFFLLFTHATAAFEIGQEHVLSLETELEESNISSDIRKAEEWTFALAISNSLDVNNPNSLLSTQSQHIVTEGPGTATINIVPSCPICMEDLSSHCADRPIAGCESCTQMFHGDCFGRWVRSKQSSQLGPSCPKCRSTLTEEYAEDLVSMIR